MDGTLHFNVSEIELNLRHAGWKPRETGYNSGTLWKYAQQVGSAVSGAVTHPGGVAGEKTYGDI